MTTLARALLTVAAFGAALAVSQCIAASGCHGDQRCIDYGTGARS